MRSRELQRMLAEATRLTTRQRQALVRALSSADEAAQVVHTLQSRPPSCPHCQDERVVRNGHASGMQRYKCRACARTFNALTSTPLARLRHKGKWERQAEALRQGLSVHRAADALDVAPSTAFRWRHRFQQLARDVKAQVLQGVVEADETYFLRSSKAQSVCSRQARHRGGRAAKRGLSDEQEPVLVVRDRSRATADFILERADKRHTIEALAPMLAPDAVLCTDCGGALGAAARHLGVEHHPLNISKGTAGAGRLAHPERQRVPQSAQALDATVQGRGQFAPGQLPGLVPSPGPVSPNTPPARAVPCSGGRGLRRHEVMSKGLFLRQGR